VSKSLRSGHQGSRVVGLRIKEEQELIDQLMCILSLKIRYSLSFGLRGGDGWVSEYAKTKIMQKSTPAEP